MERLSTTECTYLPTYLRRSFKIAGCLGLWWRATNGILWGCPLSVILINVLMGIRKEEIDSLRRQICA